MDILYVAIPSLFILSGLVFVLIHEKKENKKLSKDLESVNKKLKTQTNQLVKKIDSLLDIIDSKSIDVAKAVKCIRETFDDFELPYNEVGRIIDEKNCPNYLIKFGDDYQILISYDFQNITVVLGENDMKIYENWKQFEEEFESILSIVRNNETPHYEIEIVEEENKEKENEDENLEET